MWCGVVCGPVLRVRKRGAFLRGQQRMKNKNKK